MTKKSIGKQPCENCVEVPLTRCHNVTKHFLNLKDDFQKKSFYWDPQPEVEKVTELANLVRRKYFVSEKIFGNITYNA